MFPISAIVVLLLLLLLLFIVVVQISMIVALMPGSLFITLLVLVRLVAHPVSFDVEHPDAPTSLPLPMVHPDPGIVPIQTVVPGVGLNLEAAQTSVVFVRRVAIKTIRQRCLPLLVDLCERKKNKRNTRIRAGLAEIKVTCRAMTSYARGRRFICPSAQQPSTEIKTTAPKVNPMTVHKLVKLGD